MIYRRSHAHGTGFMVEAESQDELPLDTAGEIWAQPDWPITWHENNGWELYFQSKGSSDWQIGKDNPHVPEQGAYLIRGGKAHRVTSFNNPQSHYYFVVFDSTQIPEELIDQDCWHEDYVIFPDASALLLPFQGLIQELSIHASWCALNCEAYIRAMCTHCVRLSKQHKPIGKNEVRHPAIERAICVMKSRLDYPWTLEELSRLSWVSSSYLISLFREEHGETPMRHLTTLRMEEARRQLQSSTRSVTEIAMDCGFSSSQHLASVCRKKYHCSPSQLRSKER